MRAHSLILRQQISIIPCTKIPQSAHARVHVEILPNTHCLLALQHKSLKNPRAFHKKMQISPPRALAKILGKPSESEEFCQMQRFHVTARCTRDTPIMRPGHESLAKNTTRATCAHRRARLISLTDFLNFCARRLPHRPCHHHRDHVPHRRMDITIVGVVASIGSVIAAPSSPSSSLPL